MVFAFLPRGSADGGALDGQDGGWASRRQGSLGSVVPCNTNGRRTADKRKRAGVSRPVVSV